MNKNGPLILGVLLLLAGAFSLASLVFQIDFWAVCFPVGLIALGVVLLFRERLFPPGGGSQLLLAGSIRRQGSWQVRDENLYLFAGDVRLDFRSAVFPPGDSAIQVYGFVGDIELIAPPEIGVALTTSAFLASANLWGHKNDYFFTPHEEQSPGFERAERRVHVGLTYFIADLDALQAPALPGE